MDGDPAFRIVSYNARRPTEDLLECLICQKDGGNYLQISRKNWISHSNTWKHKTYQEEFNQQELILDISQPARDLQPPPLNKVSQQYSFEENDEVMTDDLWSPVHEAHEGEQPEEEDLAECIRALASQQLSCQFPPAFASGEYSELPDGGQEDEGDHELEDEGQNTSQPSVVTNPAYPWPSMSMFLTQLLFSGSARVRFSESQKQAVLEWAKALGTQDVPTLSALKKAQESIEKMVGQPTEKVVSSLGTIFYINDVGKAIARDFANPITRLAMTEYPQDGGEGVSELKNGDKWLLELPRDLLTVTARVNGKIYFTGELLQCQDGSYFIPDRFFTVPQPSNNGTPPIDTLFALGNTVERTMMIDKEFCTKFVTSSPHATPMELVKALKDSIEKSAERGVNAFDCKHDEECLLVPHAHFWGSDNPMQAEECSQAGLQCNFFCRTCEVGGTQEVKRSDTGFMSLFQSGVLRTPEKTAEQIRKQLQLAPLHGAADKLTKHKAATGVNDSTCANTISAIVELGKAMYTGTHPDSKDLTKEQIHARLKKELDEVVEGHGINPLIGMPGVDMHKDTPTEILHTVLLGVVKYFWGQTVWILGKTKGFSTFQAPSRDSCYSFATQDITKHIVTGGSWKDPLTGKWVRAGQQVLQYMRGDKHFRKLLAIPNATHSTSPGGQSVLKI
ncbi:hypothetical protein PQX77_016965 [Marasmius sp. AFHP31]|nr:hypothetical protein PQX77_016965 [Marasmius sp. AFHP31]